MLSIYLNFFWSGSSQCSISGWILIREGFSGGYFILFQGWLPLLNFCSLSRERFLEKKEHSEEHYLLGPRGNGFIIVSLLAMFLYVGAEIGSSSWITTYLVKGLGAIYPGRSSSGSFLGCLNHRRFVFAFLSRSLSYLLFCVFSSLLSLGFLLLLNFTHEIHWAVLAFGGVGFG
jgi:fucose permease